MKHYLIVDRKVSTWIREKVEVEADTIEEAIERVKDSDYRYMDIWDSEEFSDCEEQMYDSNNEPILEIRDDHYEILFSDEHE